MARLETELCHALVLNFLQCLVGSLHLFLFLFVQGNFDYFLDAASAQNDGGAHVDVFAAVFAFKVSAHGNNGVGVFDNDAADLCKDRGDAIVGRAFGVDNVVSLVANVGLDFLLGSFDVIGFVGEPFVDVAAADGSLAP